MDAIEIFADHVIRSDFDSLSPDAVEATRTFIQDSLGVGIVGSAALQVDEMRRAAALWGRARMLECGFSGSPCRHHRRPS